MCVCLNWVEREGWGACSWFMSWQSNCCFSVILGQKSHKIWLFLSWFFFSVEYEWTSVRDNARTDTQLALPNICFELELRQYHSRGSAVVPNLIIGCDVVAVTSDERYCFLSTTSTNSTEAKLTVRRKKKSDSDLLVYLIIYFTPQTQTVCNRTD